jgi:hypothetical protein
MFLVVLFIKIDLKYLNISKENIFKYLFILLDNIYI